MMMKSGSGITVTRRYSERELVQFIASRNDADMEAALDVQTKEAEALSAAQLMLGIRPRSLTQILVARGKVTRDDAKCVYSFLNGWVGSHPETIDTTQVYGNGSWLSGPNAAHSSFYGKRRSVCDFWV